MIELLAPAGGKKELIAGVFFGADAIYFGGKQFSARSSAENFDLDEIKKIRILTWNRGVKLYLTLNTLIYNNEFHQALEYVGKIVNLGIDGIIMQDIGLIKEIESYFPEMELHGSTQLSIHNKFGVLGAKELGLKRIVIPREATLSDIHEMSEIGIELEAFVHGAICISYSGQCLFSSLVGARSGNRGKCAQPCRLSFYPIDMESGKRLDLEASPVLSPKDMNLSGSLEDLIKAGVVSLKIEGRMKNSIYVGTVVNFYAKELEKILNDRPKVVGKLSYKIDDVFNREFTDGYLKNDFSKSIMNPKRSSNKGIFIGRVESFKEGILKVKINTTLNEGDEVQVFAKSGRFKFTVKKDSKYVLEIKTKAKIADGERVFLIERKNIESDIVKVNDLKKLEKLDLKVIVLGSCGKKLILKGESFGNNVEVSSEQILEEAINRPLTKDSFISQMRIGNSSFNLVSVDFKVEGSIMLPISILNNLRRELINKLDNKIFYKNKEFNINALKLNSSVNILNKCIYIGSDNLALVRKFAGENSIYCVYPLIEFKGSSNSYTELVKFLEQNRDIQSNIILELPRIITSKDNMEVIRRIMETKNLVFGFRAHTLDGLVLLKSLDIKNIYGSEFLNVTNDYSLNYYKNELKVKGISLSEELNFKKLKNFKNNGENIVKIFGIQEIMINRYCLKKDVVGCKKCYEVNIGIEDEKGYVFPIRTDENCYMHIYNSKVKKLEEEVRDLFEVGFRNFYIEVSNIPIKDSISIVNTYMSMLDKLANSENINNELSTLKKYENYTKGHFNRGAE